MKLFSRIVLIYFSLLALFTLFVIASHLIPSSKISKNVVQSLKVLQKEGLYPKFFDFKLFQMDNFTDVYMLNLSLSVNSSHPVESAMMNYYYRANDFDFFAYDTENVALNKTEGLEKKTYNRYWHGYQVFLRPVLLVLNYSQIRFMNFVLFFTLIAICTRLIYRKIGLHVVVFFILSLALINFPIVPLSMQFSTVFYIAFFAIIFILSKNKILEKDENVWCLFFIIGALTSYMDLLTVPLITLGLPLMIYQLSVQNDRQYLTTIKLSISWGLGYAVLWVSKWVVAYILTGINPFTDVMDSAAERSSNLYKGMEMTIPNIFRYIFETAHEMNLTWLLYGAIILAIGFLLVYFVFLLKSKKVFWKYGWLLLIAVAVPAWYLLLRNHSIQHGWFTWRALLVSLFAVFIFLYHTVDWKKKNLEEKYNDLIEE